MADRDTSREKGITIRQVLCIIIFLLIVVLMLAYFFRVFDAPTETQQTVNTFYAEEENTLDGVYIGTSAVYRYWMAPMAYDEYGMAVFNMGTASQSLSVTKYIMDDAIKRHDNLKVLVVEIRNVVKFSKNRSEADFRRVTDNMPNSINRFRAINDSLAYFKEMGIDIDYHKADYYFPFIKYHSRWNDDLKLADLKAPKETGRYKGYIMTGSFGVEEFEDPGVYTGTRDLYKPTEKVLRDLLEYCKSIDDDTEVIFVASPMVRKARAYELLNRASEIIREEGFTVWDFNQEPLKTKLNMDWSGDFYESSHTNVYGAERYTRCLAKMLHEELNLEDHRGQKGYESWEESTRLFNERLEEESER